MHSADLVISTTNPVLRKPNMPSKPRSRTPSESAIKLHHNLPAEERPTVTLREVEQRHHDYYVGLKRCGKLTHPDDQTWYDLAMEREQRGDVDPLPENEVLLKELEERRTANKDIVKVNNRTRPVGSPLYCHCKGCSAKMVKPEKNTWQYCPKCSILKRIQLL